ncbi:MAG TPA: 1,4-dihydroxy-2-naphthoate polyprenyltransferase [Candidatus Dormibacteraeota bacterium]|jgi:1,4-dihydroxy-2-naphthoate octaprenyltransferase|nr:1,4-dihydroxy-2-naphthoate polyprenyltransferase [Candidatus Dormibacteraeota bacterium]
MPHRAAGPPTRLRVWISASRPPTLAASVSPVLAAVALTVHDGAYRPLAAIGALAVAIAMQFGVNFANDYSDFKRGADTPSRVGPLRAAASGVVPPGQVRLAAIACFGLAGLIGLALALTTDWWLVPIGILAVLAGWLYTGGPRPYGYIGLGEVFVFLFFGLFATVGTVWVIERTASPAAWLLGATMGLLACAVLTINNLRDIRTDRQARKMTLAVRLGAPVTRMLILAEFSLALLLPVLAIAYAGMPAFAILPLVTAPMMVQVWRICRSSEPRPLIAALRRAAAIEVWFALLWALGMVL